MTNSDSRPSPSSTAHSAVRSRLLDRVRSVLEDGSNGTSRVERVAVPFPESAAPLPWLRAQTTEERAYWSGRDDEKSVATVGAADVLMSTESPVSYERLARNIEGRLQGAPGSARYFGGLRFDAAQTPPDSAQDGSWSAFGTYRFVLPRFEFVRGQQSSHVACNLVVPRDRRREEEILAAIQRLAFPDCDVPSSLSRPQARTDIPGRSKWERMVRWALASIGEGPLDKVVLARRVGLTVQPEVDPLLVFQHLVGATPGCFHFALQPGERTAFVGASPERLFRRRGDRVVTEAVAGTRGRGKTPEADAALRRELMSSAKERREHAFVQEALEKDLETLCSSVDKPARPSDLALARGRHLHAALAGTLRKDVSTFDLLDVLHPTPAVGGVPVDESLTAIRGQEPFDRGWYAGPVGWIGTDEAEFAVAIRSGLIRESRIALFSGAGIVEGSVPDQEWEEIEQKIADFAAILGLKGAALPLA